MKDRAEKIAAIQKCIDVLRDRVQDFAAEEEHRSSPLLVAGSSVAYKELVDADNMLQALIERWFWGD